MLFVQSEEIFRCLLWIHSKSQSFQASEIQARTSYTTSSLQPTLISKFAWSQLIQGGQTLIIQTVNSDSEMNSRRDPTRKRKFSMVQTKLFRQLVQKLASRGNSFKLKYALWGTEISECGVMGTRSLREMATSKVSSSTSTNFETEVRDFFWHMG